MQRYQPPHQRRAGVPHAAGSSTQGSASANGPSAPARFSRGGNTAQPSRRDWSQPNGVGPSYTLASPASDLRPMRTGQTGKPRGGAVDVDEMDLIQSVSRSGGDGAEGDALKDWSMQERYRGYIDERLDKHYVIFPRERHTPPPDTATDELQSLGSIVLLLRKLREGVVASHRIDNFAVEVFETSARIAILARNHAQLLSSLSGLVPGLYNAVNPKGKGPATAQTHTKGVIDTLTNGLASVTQDNGASYTDSRAEFVSILLLYHLVQSQSPETFHSTLVDLTSPPRRAFGITDPSTVDFLPRDKLCFAMAASRALRAESFDSLLYFSLLKPDSSRSSPYQRAVLSWAKDRVREKAWSVLSKAYIDCETTWAARWIGYGNDKEIQDWVDQHQRRIEGGQVKLR